MQREILIDTSRNRDEDKGRSKSIIDALNRTEKVESVNHLAFERMSALDTIVSRHLISKFNNPALVDYLKSESGASDLKKILVLDYFLDQFNEDKKKSIESQVFEILNRNEGFGAAVKYAACSLYQESSWWETHKRNKEIRTILEKIGGIEEKINENNASNIQSSSKLKAIGNIAAQIIAYPFVGLLPYSINTKIADKLYKKNQVRPIYEKLYQISLFTDSLIYGASAYYIANMYNGQMNNGQIASLFISGIVLSFGGIVNAAARTNISDYLKQDEYCGNLSLELLDACRKGVVGVYNSIKSLGSWCKKEYDSLLNAKIEDLSLDAKINIPPPAKINNKRRGKPILYNILLLDHLGSRSFNIESTFEKEGHSVKDCCTFPTADESFKEIDLSHYQLVMMDPCMEPIGFTEEEKNLTGNGCLSGLVWMDKKLKEYGDKFTGKVVFYNSGRNQQDILNWIQKKGNDRFFYFDMDHYASSDTYEDIIYKKVKMISHNFSDI